ncbi:hypothetical protein HaLaN_22569 [Haematococcus lacustris]|uniref:Uncharacterized protein n=1 Tax=Haematococcus lacustris TaxID=44745 RepID=A0A699ZYF9_HAELA|nr:hypothetical protein HaLaN_22569 [Haematococcus lacustris]
MLMPVFEDPSNQALLAKLQELGSIDLIGDNTIGAHSMQLAVAMQQHYSNPEVYLDPKWAQQRLRLYGAQDRAQFFKKLEDMAELSMKRHGRAKQLVVFFGAAGIGTAGGKRTKAEPAAEPNKGKGKAAKAKPAPQPGRWLDRDCNAALDMQRIGESWWRPLELCWWPEQGKLPAKGKEYPGLGYKRLRDKPPKAQEQQPAVAL